MFVCEHCLEAIESREGSQLSKRIDFGTLLEIGDMIFESEDTGEEVMICEWCEEETLVSEMYEMR